MPTIADIKKQYPELDGMSDDDVVDTLHQTFYADRPIEDVANALGVKKEAPPPPSAGVMDYARGVGSGLLEGVAGTVAGVGTFLQAPAANTLSGLVGAAALADRGVTSASNWVSPGSAQVNPDLQREAQQTSAFAAEERAKNVEGGGVTGSIAGAAKGMEWFGREASQALQDFDKNYNPALTGQKERFSAAEGFWENIAAPFENPLAFANTMARSAPDMALGVGAGAAAATMRMSKAAAAAEMAGAAAAKGVAAKGGDLLAQDIAKKAAMTSAHEAAQKSATGIAGTVGILSESASAAYGSRESTYQEVMKLPANKLASSHRFQELLLSTGDAEQARETLANELADQTPMLVSLGTALGSMAITKITGRDLTAELAAGAKKTTFADIGKNAVLHEGPEEMLQGIPESAVQWQAGVQADQDKKLDMGGAIAQNFMAGAAMGGGGTGISYVKDNFGGGPDVDPALEVAKKAQADADALKAQVIQKNAQSSGPIAKSSTAGQTALGADTTPKATITPEELAQTPDAGLASLAKNLSGTHSPAGIPNSPEDNLNGLAAQAEIDRRAQVAHAQVAQVPPNVGATFVDVLNTDNVYQGWSNIRDGQDHQSMVDQMAYVQKTYSGKVTNENLEDVRRELTQQFKWFRAATPEQKTIALEALKTGQPVQEDPLGPVTDLGPIPDAPNVAPAERIVSDGGHVYDGSQDGDILGHKGVPFGLRKAAEVDLANHGAGASIVELGGNEGFVIRKAPNGVSTGNGPDAGVSSPAGGNIPIPSVATGSGNGAGVGPDAGGIPDAVLGATPAVPGGSPAETVAPKSEWNAFDSGSGTLNIPRSEMPQIKAEHRGALVNYLKARGIAATQETVDPATLKPTQSEYSTEKIKKALNFEGADRSILVSSDNHILDGHHQWIPKQQSGTPIEVIRLDAPIDALLSAVREFPSATVDESSAPAAEIKHPLPSYLAKFTPAERELFQLDAAEANAKKRFYQGISETENKHGEVIPPEAAMHMLHRGQSAVGAFNAVISKSGNGTRKELMTAWVHLNQIQNEIDASRNENPAMWAAYDARQEQLKSVNVGDKVYSPLTSPEHPTGRIVTLAKKNKVNWTLKDDDMGTMLAHPSAIRPVAPAALSDADLNAVFDEAAAEVAQEKAPAKQEEDIDEATYLHLQRVIESGESTLKYGKTDKGVAVGPERLAQIQKAVDESKAKVAAYLSKNPAATQPVSQPTETALEKAPETVQAEAQRQEEPAAGIDTSLLPESTSPAVNDFLQGKRDDAPTVEEVAAESKAPAGIDAATAAAEEEAEASGVEQLRKDLKALREKLLYGKNDNGKKLKAPEIEAIRKQIADLTPKIEKIEKILDSKWAREEAEIEKIEDDFYQSVLDKPLGEIEDIVTDLATKREVLRRDESQLRTSELLPENKNEEAKKRIDKEVDANHRQVRVNGAKRRGAEKRIDELKEKQEAAEEVLDELRDADSEPPIFELNASTNDVDIDFLEELKNSLERFARQSKGAEKKTFEKRVKYLTEAIQAKEDGKPGLGTPNETPAQEEPAEPLDAMGRPLGWEKSITKAWKVAESLGIELNDENGKVKMLPVIVPEIQAFDAGKDLPAKPENVDTSEKPVQKPEETEQVVAPEETTVAAEETDVAEDEQLGANPEETRQIEEAFSNAEKAQDDGEYQVHHLFDAPAKDSIFRMQKKAEATGAVIPEKESKLMNKLAERRRLAPKGKEAPLTPDEDARLDAWIAKGQAQLAGVKEQVRKWKEHAQKQGDGNANSQKVVISLFDLTGVWSQPWVDAGYQVFTFDLQNSTEYEQALSALNAEEGVSQGYNEDGEYMDDRVNPNDVNSFSVQFFNDMFGDFDGMDVHAVLAGVPCTDFASSSSRHFAVKDANGQTHSSVELVHQTLRVIEYFKPAVWAIENPVGRIEKLGGLPPWTVSFQPSNFGDPYTKQTLLWGRMNGDMPVAPIEPIEGSKMHTLYGGKSQKTKNARSETPEGFAYAFFMANNAVDNPVLAIAGKYDRLDRGLIAQAVAAGVTEEQINDAVEDLYYGELDDEGANDAIRELIANPDSESEDAKATRENQERYEQEYQNSLYGTVDKPLKFLSGMSAPKDFAAAFAAEKSVGISISALSNVSIPKLAKAMVDTNGSYLFIDTGAFSVFRYNQKIKKLNKNLEEDGPLFAAEIEQEKEMDHDAIIERVNELHTAIGEAEGGDDQVSERVFLVMPDIVGDQAGSLELVKQYKKHINAWHSSIVPLQGGELTLKQAFEKMMENLGLSLETGTSPIIGIPSKAAAVSNEQFKELLDYHRHLIGGIHILGAYADKTLGPRIEAIKEAGYDGPVSADANRLRSLMWGDTTRADAMRKLLGTSDTTEKDIVALAKEILDAAELSGKERVDALKDVKAGTITIEELREAYPSKAAIPAWIKAQFKDTAFELSVDGNKVVLELAGFGRASVDIDKVAEPFMPAAMSLKKATAEMSHKKFLKDNNIKESRITEDSWDDAGGLTAQDVATTLQGEPLRKQTVKDSIYTPHHVIESVSKSNRDKGDSRKHFLSESIAKLAAVVPDINAQFEKDLANQLKGFDGLQQNLPKYALDPVKVRKIVEKYMTSGGGMGAVGKYILGKAESHWKAGDFWGIANTLAAGVKSKAEFKRTFLKNRWNDVNKANTQREVDGLLTKPGLFNAIGPKRAADVLRLMGLNASGKPMTERDLARVVRETEVQTFNELAKSPSMVGKSLEKIRAELTTLLPDSKPEAIEKMAKELQKAVLKDQAEIEKNKHRNPETLKQAMVDAMPAAMEIEKAPHFQVGFQHALSGKSKSTLSGEQLPAMQLGYEAAKKWIATDEGRAYYEGKPAHKLENTGVDLRRHWELMQAQMKANESDISKVWKSIERATNRADLFKPLLPDGVKPGFQLYVTELRDLVPTFKKWMEEKTRWYGSGAYRSKWGGSKKTDIEYILDGERYPGELSAEDRQKFQTDAAYRADYLRNMANEYLAKVKEYTGFMNGVVSVKDAATKFEAEFINKVNTYSSGTISGFDFTEKGVSFVAFNNSDKYIFAKLRASGNWVEALIEKEDTAKLPDRATPLTPPKLDRVTRSGLADHRGGKDITPTQFKTEFGFADVGFGNWVGAKQDQDHLNYAYDAFKDLSKHFGTDPKNIGMGMHFTIGALGHGKFSAHFQQAHPTAAGPVQVINLTNTRGDGTVYHEWTHGLDFNMGGEWKDGKAGSVRTMLLNILKHKAITVQDLNDEARRFLVGGTYWVGNKHGDKVDAAIRGIRQKRSAPSVYKTNADALGKDYWGNDEELIARAAEAWAVDTLGGEHSYLVNKDWAGDGVVTPAKGFRGTPYPMGEERLRMNRAMSALAKATKWVDGKPTITAADFREAFGKDDADIAAEQRREELLTEDGMKTYHQELLAQRAEANAAKEAEYAAKNEEKRAQEAKEREIADKLAADKLAELEALDPPKPDATQGALDDSDLSALFDQAAAELREEGQEKPEEPTPGEASTVQIPQLEGWSYDELTEILEKSGNPDMIVTGNGTNIPGVMTINQIGALGNTKMLGFGVFQTTGVDDNGKSWTINWDGGGAMERTSTGKAYSVASVNGPGVAPFPKGVQAAIEAERAKKAPKKEAKPQEAQAQDSPLVQQSAAALIADAAKLGVSGINDALTGLAKLFGSKPGRLNSFPSGFDQDTYNEAKPHFESALAKFQAAGKNLKDLFKMLIQHFGDGVKMYAIQFAKDKNLTNNLGQQDAAPESASSRVAKWVQDKIASGTEFKGQELFDFADTAFGGTQAEGKYTPKDAYDAMEMGMNRYILANPMAFNPNNDSEVMSTVARLQRLTQLLATQTKRTAEQDEFQQFSTPPAFSFVANWVSGVGPTDVMMEPSAGIGGLAIFARNAGAELVLNELSSRRADVLQEVFPTAKVYRENAEQINNILPDEIRPTKVVMNPPFSASAGRLQGERNTKLGAQHVEQALARLEDGGRLVAIVGEGMTMDKATFKPWWRAIQAKYNVRAVIPVDGKGYAKYGTTFSNAILVIDKVPPTGKEVVTTPASTYDELVGILKEIRNDRPITNRPDTSSERDIAESERQDAIPEGKNPDGVGVDSGQPDLLGGEGTGSGSGVGGGSGGRSGPSTAKKPKRPIQQPSNAGDGDGANAGGSSNGVSAENGGSDTAPEQSGLSIGGATVASGELTNSIFENYRPQRLQIPGALGHPGPLVQSAAMASVLPPAAKYTPNLPAETITEGKLSLAQLESVVYAGQAHQEFLEDKVSPDVATKFKITANQPYRKGFFIGDGTGVGKGREIGGIILDNLRQGRKKAIWISEKTGLLESAKRDFEGVGGNPALLFGLSDTKASDAKVGTDAGIMFTTYTTLKMGGAAQGTGKPATKNQVEKLMPVGATVELSEGYSRPDLSIGTVVHYELPQVTAIYGHDPVKLAEMTTYEIVDNTSTTLPGGTTKFVTATRISDGTRLSLDTAYIKGALKPATATVLEVDFSRLRGRVRMANGQTERIGLGAITKVNGESVNFIDGDSVRAAIDRKAGKKTKADGISRIQQVVDWCGPDFDGVIAFDESHNAGNAVEIKGERGTSKPSQQALSMIELQRRLPKARIVYVSATGATTVENLAYANRLGLWGAGTAFPDVKNFVSEMMAGGLATMELVARDMKQMGVYMARSLSFDGVTYGRIDHELTPIQTEAYNKMAEAWQMTLTKMEEAMVETGVTEMVRDRPVTRNSDAKKNVKAAYWGAQLRFFNQVITSMQMPSVLEQMDKDIADGKALVLQLVNTNEAALDRAMEENKDEEDADLADIDLTPQSQLVEMIRKVYPVVQMQEVIDADGNKKSEPVKDAEGNFVLNRDAVAKRDALMEEIASMRNVFPDAPLDMVLKHFGVETVAEVTGRGKRIVHKVGKSGEVEPVLETRGAHANAADANAFMDDKKRILIFSNAGGTGYSFHADLTKTNQRKRSHYLIQPGWRADKAVQGFGRSHRTNQKSAPHYWLAATNIPAHKRFLSAIARRLDMLGAMTKGQRDTANQGMFSEKDNLDSKYAQQAVNQLVKDAQRGQLVGLSFVDFMAQTGLSEIVDPNTGMIADSKMPKTSQFLNRMLSMSLHTQELVFEAFIARMEEKIDVAIQRGELDAGMETIKALSTNIVQDDVIYTDPKSGADTRLVNLELKLQNQMYPFPQDKTQGGKIEWVKNAKSGRVWAKVLSGNSTLRSGAVVDRFRMLGTGGTQIATADKFRIVDGAPNFTKITEDQARELWDKETSERPETITKNIHMIVGALLPIWDRLRTGDAVMRVMRTQTEAGERLLGRIIADKDVKDIRARLNVASPESKIPPAEVMRRILKGEKAELANGWTLDRVTVAQDLRIEVKGIPYYQVSGAAGNELVALGVIKERIAYNERLFVPTGVNGVAVLESILKSKPIAYLGSSDKPAEQSGPAETAFSRTTKQAKGLPTSTITGITTAIASRWKNAPEIIVASSIDDTIIPESVRNEDQKQKSLGAKGAPEAFVHGGKVYLIADQLATPGAVVQALFHESLGHLGLRGVFGNSLDQVLNQIVLARKAEVEAKARQYGWDTKNKGDMLKAAEEVLAVLAQSKPELGIIKRAIAAIRTWLREHIPQLQSMHLTDDEIVNRFIIPARRFIENGSGGPKGGVAFSLKNNLNTVAAAWKKYAADDAGFKFGNTPAMRSQSIHDIAKAFSTPELTLTVDTVPMEEKGVQLIVNGNARRGRMTLSHQSSSGNYKIDAIEAQPSLGIEPLDNQGQRMYQALFAYAHNNGLTVDSDFSLSYPNEIRRTSAMLSSALRFGTTDYFGDVGDQQAVVGWNENGYAGNIKALAMAEAAKAAERIPAFDQLEINPESGVVSYVSLPSEVLEWNDAQTGERVSVDHGSQGQEPGRVGAKDSGSGFGQGNSSGDSAGQTGTRRDHRGTQGDVRSGAGAGVSVGDGASLQATAIPDSKLASYLASTRGGFQSHGVGVTTLKRALLTRAALENDGATFGTPGLLNSRKAGNWYSELGKQILANKATAMPAEMWARWINSLTTKGVKPAEIEWSGVQDWLRLQTGKVSKSDLMTYLDANGVQVEEVTLGGDQQALDDWENAKEEALANLRNLGYEPIWAEHGEGRRIEGVEMVRSGRTFELGDSWEDGEGEDAMLHLDDILTERDEAILLPNDERNLPKYGKYQLPGGTNYRELLLTLPTKNPDVPSIVSHPKYAGQFALQFPSGEYVTSPDGGATTERTTSEDKASNWETIEYAQYGIKAHDKRADVYKSNHWDQANVLAHIRLNDRTDSEGNKVLFVEEIQSDFAQDYRKSKDAIGKSVDNDFMGIVKRMEQAGVLEVKCD